MSSPLPPDPYAALGVSKDCDLSQIRTAHRKLVLKYHPDRIKGDNFEEKERAKNEFQKVQQAYELLSDSAKRSRYDDHVKLVELQRDKLIRDARSGYSSKSTSGSTVIRREVRKDGVNYEERAPPTSYFEKQDRFDENPAHTSARKHETPYEKERKPSVQRTTEKKASSRATSPVAGISPKIADKLKARSAFVRERVGRTEHAKTQETRDREKRRERSDKHTGRQTAYAEDASESEAETIIQRPIPKPSRTSSRQMPDSESVRSRPSRGRRGTYDDEDSHDEKLSKWEQHHKTSVEYINESKKRPDLPRSGSDAYAFWDMSGGRRSGSDTERRSAPSRRTKVEEHRRHPSMPIQSSAPSNLRPYVEERVPEKAPQRAKTGPYPPERAMPPSLNRAQTMPANKTVRKDTAPSKGSHLKHSETQDSGYYSSSNPNTPEFHAESPSPTRDNPKKKGSNSTKYQIVTPETDDDRASHIRILDSDEDNRNRRYRSPDSDRREPDRRDRDKDRREREKERERERERERDRDERDRVRERERRPIRTESDSRPRPSRTAAPTSYTRSEFRNDGPPSRSSPSVRGGKLFGELSSDEREPPYRYDPNNVKTASYRPPMTSSYSSARFRDDDYDHVSGSTFREQLRYPGQRRPSAAI